MSHLSSRDFLSVYEPADDSYLMMSALDREHDFLHALAPNVCLEIG